MRTELRQRGRVVPVVAAVVVLPPPPLLILTNLEVVRQSNAGVCHLGLFRVPAELFDVTDVRLGIREGGGWGGVGVFFLFLLD